jgi:uncharacterized membrane protein HdeD (DUF308 family)
MTSDVGARGGVRENVRAEAAEISAVSWTYLILGILWILYGGLVLSYRAGSVAAVAGFVGVALIFGGVADLVVATRVRSGRWLYMLSGILGIAAGVVTFAWPDITLYVVSVLLAWYLIFSGVVHIVHALADAPVPRWWTGLLLGVAELVLGVWAVHSWQASLLTLMTLVGVWAICHGVNELYAGLTVRQVGKRAEELLGA